MVAVELPADITASFVDEARSYLPRISKSLARIQDRATLEDAYRFAHTIKSSAAMLGHIGLSQVAELLEGDLECLLMGEVPLDGQLAQLARSADRIGRLLDGVAGQVVDVDGILSEEVDDRLGVQDGTEGGNQGEAEHPGDVQDELQESWDEGPLVQDELSPILAQVLEDYDERGVNVGELLAIVDEPDTHSADATSAQDLPAAVMNEAVAVLGQAVTGEEEAVGGLGETAAAEAVLEQSVAGEVDATIDPGCLTVIPSEARDPNRLSSPVTTAFDVPSDPSHARDDGAAALPEPVAEPADLALAQPELPQDLAVLIDSLAETVLAFGREVSLGAPDLAAYRAAVHGWLNTFDGATGAADHIGVTEDTVASSEVPAMDVPTVAPAPVASLHEPAPATQVVAAEPVAAAVVEASGPAPIELDPDTGREEALRAAIEAEVRYEIEMKLRTELLAGPMAPMAPTATAVSATPSATASPVAPLSTAARAETVVARPEPREPIKNTAATDATALNALAPSPAVPAGLDLDAELLEVFRLEAAEHLKRIDADVSALRASPDDVERLRSLRRTVHTLKGAAAMMGVEPVAQLSHALEDRLEGFTEFGQTLDTAAHVTLLADLDRLEALIMTGVAGGEPAAAAEPVFAPLVETSETTTSSETPSGVDSVDTESTPESTGAQSETLLASINPTLHFVPAQEVAADGNSIGRAEPAALHIQVRMDQLDGLLTLAGESAVAAGRWPKLLGDATNALDDLRRASARVQALHTTLLEEQRRVQEQDEAARRERGRHHQASDPRWRAVCPRRLRDT